MGGGAQATGVCVCVCACVCVCVCVCVWKGGGGGGSGEGLRREGREGDGARVSLREPRHPGRRPCGVTTNTLADLDKLAWEWSI